MKTNHAILNEKNVAGHSQKEDKQMLNERLKDNQYHGSQGNEKLERAMPPPNFWKGWN